MNVLDDLSHCCRSIPKCSIETPSDLGAASTATPKYEDSFYFHVGSCMYQLTVASSVVMYNKHICHEMKECYIGILSIYSNQMMILLLFASSSVSIVM